MGRVSDAKQRLMDAVLDLIWSGSYGTTTIDDICEKAGVKKGSFYYFFESKAELAAEAFEESWKDKRIELDTMFSPRFLPWSGSGNMRNSPVNSRPISKPNMAGYWVARTPAWVRKYARKRINWGRRSKRSWC